MAAAIGNYFGNSVEDDSSFELKGDIQTAVYINHRYEPLNKQQEHIFYNLVNSKRSDIEQRLSTHLKCQVQITKENRFECCVNSLEQINHVWNNWKKNRDYIFSTATALIKSYGSAFDLLHIPVEQFAVFIVLSEKSYKYGVHMLEKTKNSEGQKAEPNINTPELAAANTTVANQQQKTPDSTNLPTSKEMPANPNDSTQQPLPNQSPKQTADEVKAPKKASKRKKKRRKKKKLEPSNAAGDANQAVDVTDSETDTNDENRTDSLSADRDTRTEETRHAETLENVSSSADRDTKSEETNHPDTTANVSSSADRDTKSEETNHPDTPANVSASADKGTRKVETHHSGTPGNDKSTLFQLCIPKRLKPTKVYVFIYYGSPTNVIRQELDPLDDKLGLWQIEVILKTCIDLKCYYWYGIKVKGTIYGTNELDEDSRRELNKNKVMDIFRDKGSKNKKNEDIRNGCWNYIQSVMYNVNQESIADALHALEKYKKLKGFRFFNTYDKKNVIFDEIAQLLKRSSDIQKFFLLYIVHVTFNMTDIMALAWEGSVWNGCLNCFQSVNCFVYADICPNKLFHTLYKKATGVVMSPFAAVKYFYRCLRKEELECLLASCVTRYKSGTHIEIGDCCSMLIEGMKLKEDKAFDILINIMKRMDKLDHLEVIKTITHVPDILENTKKLINEHRIKCSADLAMKLIDANKSIPLQGCWTLLENMTEPALQQMVLKCAQKKIIDIMRKKSKWAEEEIECLLNIVKESFVFQEDSDAAVLLGYLAKYKDAVDGKLFLDVLNIRQYISQPLEQCCLNWLKNAIDNFKREDMAKENRIRLMYGKLESILNIECVYSNKEVAKNLKKLVEIESMKTDLDILLKAGCDDKLYNGKCRDIYINIVMMKLERMDKSDTSKLLTMAFPVQTPSAIVIDYEHMAMVMNTILTHDIANSYTNHSVRATDASAMKYILGKAMFWIQIIKVSGKFMTNITGNQTLRNVKQILKIVFKNIESKMVNAKFVKEIELCLKITGQDSYREDVINLFVETLTETLETLPETKYIVQVFRDIEKHISVLHSRVLQLSKVCSWVEAFDGKVCAYGKLSIYDLKQIRENVDDITKKEQCYSVTETEKSIEGFQLCSIEDLTRLDKAVGLHSVTNFTHRFFEKENLYQTECDIDDVIDLHEVYRWMYDDLDHEFVFITFDTVLHTLAQDVLPKYIDLLQAISSSSECKVSDIIDYFDNEQLEEEIQNMKELPGIELHHTLDNILRYVHDQKIFQEKCECLSRLCDVFGSDLLEDISATAQVVNSMSQITTDSTLTKLYSCFSSLEKITKNIHQPMWEIITELSKCQVLVEFLRKVKDEDLRNLIDAVEEHSEQFVDESTISHLIKIKSLLYRMLSKTGNSSLDNILKDIKECFVGDLTGVPQMINDCSCNAGSIKFLYRNVENRGEVTKSVVVQLLNDGIVTFNIDEETVTTEIAHSKKEAVATEIAHSKKKKYRLVDLADLKSRVLLIANTEKQDDKSQKHADLQEFVTFTNLLTDINALLKDLQLLGHFNFQAYKQQNNPANTNDRIQELTRLLKALNDTKMEWVEALNEMREEFCYLNYLHSTQMHVIYEYFCSGKKAEDALSIMKFIKPNLIRLLVTSQTIKFNKNDSFKIQLEKMAKSLHLALGDVDSNEHKPFCEDLNIDEIQNIKAKVKPGEVFVAHIDVKSLHSIPVLLAMYVNNTRAYPLANEVLFCNEQTNWEEVELLINRCAYISRDEVLYSIAGVEELGHENQLRLVQYLNALERNHNNFMLAVLCKADAHDFFISSMSSRVHRAVSLSHDVVEICLRSLCPQVYMITSDIAGQGKTEHVHKRAAKNGTNVKTVSINGPLTKPKLINKINIMNIKKCHTLHLDIGVNNQAGLLDNFIFELAVLRCVTAGTKCVHLNTKYIAIEVANTLDDSLRNSLQIASSFNRADNLSWNVNDLMVNREPHSAMQVVCHYLHAVNSGELCKLDVILKSNALAEDLCRFLIAKYLGPQQAMSFTILHIFLEVLANQLRRFTASQYFRITSLKAMLGNEDAVHEIRMVMVKTMIEISKEFTFQAVKSPTDASGIGNVNLSATSTSLMLSRVEGMIRWSDSNHLLVLFHGQQSLSVLYRKLSQVPDHVKKLFETQIRNQLPDYENLSQESLLSLICKMSQSKNENFIAKLGILYHSYALTPDNILKMMLIILRVRTGIPVLLMGETGCGKTTLIKYLAAAYGVSLDVFQFHAGITEDVIMDTVLIANQRTKADKLEQWLFLDEINTCNHLGLLNEIICSKTCGGVKLERNLIILSACNPYIEREKTQIYTTGLREKVREDELSCLVYRVHALPESMLDYVWDYGQITESDELAYIRKMIVNFVPANMFDAVVDVLSFSQSFIRNKESSTSVSLRDIHRARVLMPWFERFLQMKKSTLPYFEHTRVKRAILLSLSLCYGVRLSNSQHRSEYWTHVAEILNFVSKTYVLNVINAEQMDILNRMKLPDGIAKNSALRENVFVLFVCILNRMPVFIVGKPGCSKSLSMQLLRSNLRGADSDDQLFRDFPQLFVVSYQGSESSTSDGIIKVFEKAEKYKGHNEGENVLPVVLLDEVGLAEVSHSNPLKVLHSLLEPAPGELPQVAVVGISNWALDPAKMNRAVHLSRPDLTVDELVDTAEAIRSGLKTTLEKGNEVLKPLAEAYYEFQKQQTIENFHGLRDYYALIKYVCLHLPRSDKVLKLDNLVIQKGILRNFNGLSSSKCSLLDVIFSRSDSKTAERDAFISTEELIQENISDKASRHLMVVTNGNYSLGIITNLLEQKDKQFEVIIGSKFSEDQTEGYNYRILNRIILCMEQGLVLILKDLENIYGSLYDMLNQNYTTVGMKKNCRIALGAHSNPMCIVHDDFRCLVLIDSDKVNYADPPFLNRFEKQVISFRDLLIGEGKHYISEVQKWLQNFCSVDGKRFGIEDAFLGYQEDSVPSLLHMLHRIKPELPWADVVSLVKKQLLLTCPPDAILRVSVSRMANSEAINIEKIQDEYFEMMPSEGLKQYILQTCFNIHENSKLVVLTHSVINSDLQLPECDFQLEFLATFKSEKHISHQLQRFFNSKKMLLIIQCRPSVDCENMVLLKYLIENYRNRFIQTQGQNSAKHVMILVNVSRVDKEFKGWQFDYTNDWQIVTMDDLQEPKFNMKKDILGKSSYDLINAGFISVRRTIFKNLNLCFSHLRFTDGKGSAKRTLKTLNVMQNCSNLLNLIENIIIGDIKKKSIDNMHSKYHKDNWQVQLATSVEKIRKDCTFNELLRSHLVELITEVLVTILWILEETSCWASFVELQTSDVRGLQSVWENVFQGYKTRYLDNSHEKGILEISSPPLQLLFPFSLGFMNELEEVMDFFLRKEGVEEVESLPQIEDCDRLFIIEKYKMMVEQRYVEYFGNPELYEQWADLLIDDIHNMQSYHPDIELNEEYRKHLCRNYMQSKITGCVRECCPFTKVTLVLLTWSLQKAKIRQFLQLVCICDKKTQEHILHRMCEMNQSEEGDAAAPPSCEDYIVQAICSQLIATEGNVERLGGIESWFCETNRMLAYASKVTFDPPELHFLRFCVDMYMFLITKYDLDANLLVSFCNLCDSLQEEQSDESESTDTYLDSEKGFTYVSDLINKLLHEHNVSNKILQQIACRLFARCIDSNPETPRLEDITKAMCEQSLPEQLLTFCGPVLHRITRNLDIKFDGFLSEKISEYNALDSILRRIPITDQHPLVALTLDIAEKYFYDEAVGEGNFQDFKAASQIISSSKETTWSMHLLLVVAYCHIYLQWFVSLLYDNQFKPSTSLIQRMNSELNNFTNKGDICGLLLYFVRLLHKSSIKDLTADLTSVEKDLTCLKKIEWPKEEILLGIGFNAMCLNVGYSESKKLINDGKMVDLMTKIRNNCDVLEGAGAALAEKYFWVGILRVLSDTEKLQKEVVQEINTLPEYVQIVINGVLGHKSFRQKSLNLTMQSTYSEALQASFLLHLLTFVTQQLVSDTKVGLWLDVVNNMHGGVELLKQIEMIDIDSSEKDNDVQVINCSCGYTSLKRRMETKSKCPICKSEDILKYTENISYKKNKDTVFIDIASLFIDGCDLVKYILHLASDSEKADQSHISFLQHWDKLQNTLDVSEKEMLLFLHAMLNKGRGSQLIQEFVVLLKETLRNVKEESFEYKMKLMEEMKVLDGISVVLEHSNRDTLCNPFISRLTKLPSLTGLRSCIKLTSDCSNYYRFLQIVSKEEKELELLNSLPPLVKWCRVVQKYTHYKITRRDAKVLTLNDFILDASAKDVRKKLFGVFKSHWEKLRKSDTLMVLMDGIKLPEISGESFLPECIIQNKEHPLYLVMKLLCKIQNGFLKKASKLALDNYNAVCFLLKDDIVSLSCHPLYQTDLSNVVEFKWDEDYLLHSQNSTQYGKGNIVEYDLPRVERELADNLLFGKGFMVMDERFPMTIYFKEIFNRNSRILNDIKEQVKQEQLPYHIQQRFKDVNRNYGYQACKNLLNHLELILFYLHASKQKTSTSVKSFQQKWGISYDQLDNRISQNFEDEVALCHIVELYELIEQDIASVFIDSIRDKFNIELNQATIEQLHEFTQKTSAESLLVVLQCFVVRYLTQNEESLNPQDTLVSHLNECREFLPDSVIDKQEWLKQFPKTVLLSHVKHLHNQLTKDSDNAPSDSVLSKPALKTFQSRKKKCFGKT